MEYIFIKTWYSKNFPRPIKEGSLLINNGIKWQVIEDGEWKGASFYDIKELIEKGFVASKN